MGHVFIQFFICVTHKYWLLNTEGSSRSKNGVVHYIDVLCPLEADYPVMNTEK